jgi:endonuclease YncB( thermonuclease family)
MDSAAHRQALVSQLVERIDVTQDAIKATLNTEAVRHVLGLNNVQTEGPIELFSPATRIRQGKDVRMIVADQHARSADTINKPLVALLAEAQKVHQALIDSPEHSVASLADALGKCRKRSAQLLRVALLAPDLVAQCIAGTQPVSLTTKRLLNTDLPISWQEQRALLAFT